MTVHTFAELDKKRKDLDALIEVARCAEIIDAVNRVRELVAAHNLSHFNVFGGAKLGPKAGVVKNPVATKYRDSASGLSAWTTHSSIF